MQIVQPLIPPYRVPLLRRLAEHDGLCVKVCAARTEPRTENLRSVEIEDAYADLEHPFVGFLGNRLLWQRRLRLDPEMGRGDVLVLSGNLRYVSNIPLMLQAKRRNVGIVWWAHGFSRRRACLKDAVRSLAVGLSDVRLLYTDAEVEERRRLGYSPRKLFATNNAIDQRPVKEAIAEWPRKRLGEFQEQERLVGKDVLLFCGRRTNSVRLEDVFAALARLRTTSAKHCCVIIGPCNSDGSLTRKAADLGVSDVVRWLGPIFEQKKLAPWFLSARCFVCPGPIGLSLVHAFSYGLPVIVPRSTSHGPEIAALRDGENGLLYKPGSVADLALKISAMSNPPYREKLARAASRTVMNDYNMDAMVSRYVSAIKAASEMSRSK